MSGYLLLTMSSILFLSGILGVSTYVLYRSTSSARDSQFKRKSLIKFLPTSIEVVTNACHQAIDDMGLKMNSISTSSHHALFDAHGAENKRVQISLSSNSDLVSEVTIMTGDDGDEDASSMILDKIEERITRNNP